MVDLKLQDRMDQAGSKGGGKGEEPEARMTFGEHIEELRGRLLKSVVFLMLATIRNTTDLSSRPRSSSICSPKVMRTSASSPFLPA